MVGRNIRAMSMSWGLITLSTGTTIDSCEKTLPALYSGAQAPMLSDATRILFPKESFFLPPRSQRQVPPPAVPG